MLLKLAQRTSLHPNSGPWQIFTRIWSVVFIPKSDSWVIYVLMVAFPGSLKLRAVFVLYPTKTQKRYITTSLSVPLLYRNNYDSLWSNLKTKIINFNQTDGITISDFITNLDRIKKCYYCWEDSVFLLMMLQ